MVSIRLDGISRHIHPYASFNLILQLQLHRAVSRLNRAQSYAREDHVIKV